MRKKSIVRDDFHNPTPHDSDRRSIALATTIAIDSDNNILDESATTETNAEMKKLSDRKFLKMTPIIYYDEQLGKILAGQEDEEEY